MVLVTYPTRSARQEQADGADQQVRQYWRREAVGTWRLLDEQPA